MKFLYVRQIDRQADRQTQPKLYTTPLRGWSINRLPIQHRLYPIFIVSLTATSIVHNTAMPIITSTSAIAHSPRCRVGQFWPKVEDDILQTLSMSIFDHFYVVGLQSYRIQ